MGAGAATLINNHENVHAPPADGEDPLDPDDQVIRFASALDAQRFSYMNSTNSNPPNAPSGPTNSNLSSSPNPPTPTSSSRRSSITSSQNNMVFRINIALRHPTHNIPDQFHRKFYVDSSRGALLLGSKFQPLKKINLENLSKNRVPDTDEEKAER